MDTYNLGDVVVFIIDKDNEHDVQFKLGVISKIDNESEKFIVTVKNPLTVDMIIVALEDILIHYSKEEFENMASFIRMLKVGE